jgi:hypothetical protein
MQLHMPHESEVSVVLAEMKHNIWIMLKHGYVFINCSYNTMYFTSGIDLIEFWELVCKFICSLISNGPSDLLDRTPKTEY